MPSEPTEATGAGTQTDVIGVVVVTHAGPGALVRRCVDSVVAAGAVDAVVVVDNSGRSADAAAYGALPDVIRQVDNHGFGAAANVGVDAVRELLGEHATVVVLNDDVDVEAGWIDPILETFRADPRVGAVQPKLLMTGTEPPLINSVGVQLDAAGAGSDVGFNEPDDGRWIEPRDIALFSGGAVALRGAFIDDLGGFDERYFLYYEDVDLALRGAERGWIYRYEPNSVVHHAMSTTTARLGDEVRRLQERNRLWVAFRFGNVGRIGSALWLSIRRLRHRPRGVHARALAAGLAGAPRRLVERRRAT